MCAALISDQPVRGNGLIVWPYLYDAKKLSYYFAGGNTAGAIVKWFRNTLCQWEVEQQKNGGPSMYDVMNGAAEKIPAGSEGLVVLPYFMGERSPVWDSDAKGTIVGLSLTHTKGHIYRAFLEAVAYCLRDAMEATGDDLGEYILIAGGRDQVKSMAPDLRRCNRLPGSLPDLRCRGQHGRRNAGRHRHRPSDL